MDPSHGADDRRTADGPARRREVGLVVGLALLTMATRVPFWTRTLDSWDSAQLALALERYDVGLHRPHPPGYPVFVALAKLPHLAGVEANLAVVIAATVFSGVGVVGVCLLGAALYGRETGLVAGLIYAFSPLHWWLGEVALTYSAEGAAYAWGAWVLYMALSSGEARVAIGAGALLGLVGGVRTNALLFLLPAWLYSLKGHRWRARAGSALALGLASLAWALPMLVLTGGLERYRTASRLLYDQVVIKGSVPYALAAQGLPSALESLSRHALLLVTSAVGGGLVFATVPLLLSFPLVTRNSLRASLRSERAVFLYLVTLPAVGFYLLVHMAHKGYVMSLLPVLCVLAALVLPRAASLCRLRPGVLLACILVGNIGMYLVLYPHLEREHLREFAARVECIRGHFNPDDTVIVALGDYRQYGYYLREYQLYGLPGFLNPPKLGGWSGDLGYWGMRNGTEQLDAFLAPQAGQESPLVLDDDVRFVVFADERFFAVRGSRLTHLDPGAGMEIAYLKLDDAHRAFYYGMTDGWFGPSPGPSGQPGKP